MEIFPYSYSSGRDLELVDLPPEPVDVKRQDSLYRDATMPAHHGHNGQVYYTAAPSPLPPPPMTTTTYSISHA